MKTIVGLFPEPFDLADVELALADDDFFSCAFIVLGFEACWRRALDQTARLLTIFENDNRDWQPIYRLVSLLIQRAELFNDTANFLDEIVSELCLLPGGSFLEEIKMAHLHKIDPLAWQREKNRLWVENYTAQMKVLRSPSEATDAA